MAPGVYFRLMLIGYLEGLDSERGIAWRVTSPTSCNTRTNWRIMFRFEGGQAFDVELTDYH